MKKQTLPGLKKKAWDIFSRVVRKMYADHRGFVTCVTCGRVAHWKDEMQAGHFVPKARGTSVYFECRNVHVQCKSCNCNQFDKETVKIKYTLWMASMYGIEEVERLERLAHERKNNTRTDYLELIEHLKQCEAELD